MRRAFRLFLPVAAAAGAMMFGPVGSAGATCTADSSSGPDPNARTGTSIPVPLLGDGWIGAGTGGATGAAERGGVGYAEGVVQVSGTDVTAAGEAKNDSDLVGYFDGEATVTGTSVTASGDGSTLNGAVSGSAEIDSDGSPPVNDVEVAGECLTP